MDLWLKDVAPTPGLRKWFSHDPAKWKQFVQRYWKELNARPAAVALLRQKIEQGTVTPVYAAHGLGPGRGSFDRFVPVQ